MNAEFESIKKLIIDYREDIEILKDRAKNHPSFKEECFYRVTQIAFIIDDLNKIVTKRCNHIKYGWCGKKEHKCIYQLPVDDTGGCGCELAL